MDRHAMDCEMDDEMDNNSLEHTVIYPNMTKLARMLEALIGVFKQVVESFPSYAKQWKMLIRLIKQTGMMLDKATRVSPHELTHTHPWVAWIRDVLDTIDPKIRDLHQLGGQLVHIPVHSPDHALAVWCFEDLLTGLVVYAEQMTRAPITP